MNDKRFKSDENNADREVESRYMLANISAARCAISAQRGSSKSTAPRPYFSFSFFSFLSSDAILTLP